MTAVAKLSLEQNPTQNFNVDVDTDAESTAGTCSKAVFGEMKMGWYIQVDLLMKMLISRTILMLMDLELGSEFSRYEPKWPMDFFCQVPSLMYILEV